MKVTDDSVLIVAEKSAGDGLLMAKKMAGPSIGKRVGRGVARFRPLYVNSGVNRFVPPSPIGAGLMVYGC